MSAKKQCTVFVTLHIKPDQIEEFKAAHRPVWDACAKEPELMFFDVFQDPAKPGVFRFLEAWAESREWFETKQLTKPYYAEMWPKSKPTWEKEPVLEFFEREEGICSFRKDFLEGTKRLD